MWPHKFLPHLRLEPRWGWSLGLTGGGPCRSRPKRAVAERENLGQVISAALENHSVLCSALSKVRQRRLRPTGLCSAAADSASKRFDQSFSGPRNKWEPERPDGLQS